MCSLIVRRRGVITPGAVVDTVIPSSGNGAENTLRRLLTTAQAERGQLPWTTDDPEVWIGNSLVGRLSVGGDIEALIQQTIGQVLASRIQLPRYPLTVQSLNSLPEDGMRASPGVYALFRSSVHSDNPRSMHEGFTCLKVTTTSSSCLGEALMEEIRASQQTGATHFSYEAETLLIEEFHRRWYDYFHPLGGVAPSDQI